jgi:hypothetical protein
MFSQLSSPILVHDLSRILHYLRHRRTVATLVVSPATSSPAPHLCESLACHCMLDPPEMQLEPSTSTSGYKIRFDQKIRRPSGGRGKESRKVG